MQRPRFKRGIRIPRDIVGPLNNVSWVFKFRPPFRKSTNNRPFKEHWYVCFLSIIRFFTNNKILLAGEEKSLKSTMMIERTYKKCAKEYKLRCKESYKKKKERNKRGHGHAIKKEKYIKLLYPHMQVLLHCKISMDTHPCIDNFHPQCSLLLQCNLRLQDRLRLQGSLRITDRLRRENCQGSLRITDRFRCQDCLRL